MLDLVFSRFAAQWASALLVFLCSALAGRHAAEGMNLFQWAGAAAAVLGSITVAVAVRLEPSPEKVKAKRRD